MPAKKKKTAKASRRRGPRVQGRAGAFEVGLPDPRRRADRDISWREIIFEVTGDVDPIPPEQLRLKGDIESTLTTLHLIFPDRDGRAKPINPTADQHRFAAYQTKLLGIAQTGLQTPADPRSSAVWLESLHSEILAQEGQRIKSGYMRKLGLTALAIMAAATVAYLVIRWQQDFSVLMTAYRNLLPLWVGTMIGSWLSFGIRRPTLTFKDLGSLEDDMVEPVIRLVFTGLIATAFFFIFKCGMVSAAVGGLKSDIIMLHGSAAFLVGILFGISERALPGALSRRASQFVTKLAGS